MTSPVLRIVARAIQLQCERDEAIDHVATIQLYSDALAAALDELTEARDALAAIERDIEGVVEQCVAQIIDQVGMPTASRARAHMDWEGEQ